MREIEELSMNAWPGLQNLFNDGWVIRFANGYTKRANSVNPLYYSSKEINSKIILCEENFKKRNLKPIFKMTSEVFPENLDEILHNAGYKLVDYVSVQLVNIIEVAPPAFTNIKIDTQVRNEWLNDYCRINLVNEDNKITLKKMLQCIIPEAYFVSLALEGKSIACGLGVLENDYIGLFDIVVDVNYRNKGYGEQLIKNLIKIGKDKGKKKAYLQVMLNNLPALKLYSKLGFKELYQYWYRIKD